MKKQLSQTETLRFQKIIKTFYRKNKRDLPWRPPVLKLRKDGTADPYKILVSEIMLQQTQVSRVCQKFPLFISQFPTLVSLAKAPLREVLAAWSGLGYNRRAKFLHELAKKVVNEYGGEIPRDISALVKLPGLGIATASSFLAFAYNQPTVFIETNIRTVFIFHFFKNKKNVSDKEIFLLVEQTLDRKNPCEWYSALMDYGTMLKETYGNPNKKSAHYARQKRFEGSRRQLRGKILKVCIQKKGMPIKNLWSVVLCAREEGKEVLRALCKEGLLRINGDKVMIVG